jgi:hypothetical protein
MAAAGKVFEKFKTSNKMSMNLMGIINLSYFEQAF